MWFLIFRTIDISALPPDHPPSLEKKSERTVAENEGARSPHLLKSDQKKVREGGVCRTDFGGIDNDALDFSQLEDYINNDGNIYFHDELVSGESPTPGKRPCAPAPSTPAGLGSLGQRDVLPSVAALLHGALSPPEAAISAPQSTANSALTLGNSSRQHLLPESPPDSGSEPPFSPIADGK
ncbi:hypothetical protein MRX96_038113 [Rhipicephalus microplus]